MILESLQNISIILDMKTHSGVLKQVSPVLKWAGGKQGIASRLTKFFPVDFECFYEPFLGGGSILFTVHPPKAVVSDANEWLIDTYEAIRNDYREVASHLDGLVNTKEEFLRIRSIHPNTLPLSQRAAHLIYLNKTCFRGLFRVNRHGIFNVPYGEYDRRYYDLGNLRAVSELLRGVEIRRGDFAACLENVRKNDFVYLDPPYFKLGGYSDFNRYTKDRFTENDHIRLSEMCRRLDRIGVRWAVSNSNTEFIRGLFAGYFLSEIENRREINLNSQDRDITELLITNYPIKEARKQLELFATREKVVQPQ